MISFRAACLVLAGALPSATSAQEVVFRLAEIHPADHPTVRADHEFARLVNQRSYGRIRIVVYAGAVLGQEMAVLEQVQFGAIDIARVSLSAVATFVPRLEVLSMPYLYRNDEHMWRVLKGDVGKELLSSVEIAGFVGLAYLEAGSRSIYTSRRSVRTPSDMKGLKIRVQESSLMESVVTALGAKAVPLAFGEVYSAIETGAIDGAENNMPTYLTWRHDQVARYITLTEHARIPEIIVGAALSFAALSQSDRELIADAAAETVDFQRAEWTKYEALVAERIRQAGVIVIPVPNLDAWRVRARAVYDTQSPAMRVLIDRIRATR